MIGLVLTLTGNADDPFVFAGLPNQDRASTIKETLLVAAAINLLQPNRRTTRLSRASFGVIVGKGFAATVAEYPTGDVGESGTSFGRRNHSVVTNGAPFPAVEHFDRSTRYSLGTHPSSKVITTSTILRRIDETNVSRCVG